MNVPREICNPEISLFSHEWIARRFLPEPDVTGHVSSYWRFPSHLFLKTAHSFRKSILLPFPPISSTLVTRDVLIIFIENSPRLDPCQTRRTACDSRKKEVTFSPFERIFFFFFFILRSGSRVSESRVARSLEKECFNWRHRQRRELVRSFVRQICIRRKVAGKGWRERRRVPRHDYIPFLSQCSEEI